MVCLSRFTSFARLKVINRLIIQIRSQIRSAATKKFITDLPIVKLDQTEYPGQFSVTSPTDTWPIGTCLLDFELSLESVVISSDNYDFP